MQWISLLTYFYVCYREDAYESVMLTFVPVFVDLFGDVYDVALIQAKLSEKHNTHVIKQLKTEAN